MDTSDPFTGGWPFDTLTQLQADPAAHDEVDLRSTVPVKISQQNTLAEDALTLQLAPDLDEFWTSILDTTTTKSFNKPPSTADPMDLCIPEPVPSNANMVEDLPSHKAEDLVTPLEQIFADYEGVTTSLAFGIDINSNEGLQHHNDHFGGLHDGSNVDIMSGLSIPLIFSLDHHGDTILQELGFPSPPQPDVTVPFNDAPFWPTVDASSLSNAGELICSNMVSFGAMTGQDERNENIAHRPQITNQADSESNRQDELDAITALRLKTRDRLGMGYASPRDWEANKMNIRALYIDCKLDLESVIRIMADRHNFRASVQMYKKRFRKWGWRKYRDGKAYPPRQASSSKHPTPGSRSTVRCLESRTRALLYESNTSQSMEEALLSLGTVIEQYMVPDIRARNIPIYDVVGPLLDDHVSLESLINAHYYFELGDTETGAKFYQLALLDAKDIFENLDNRVYESVRLLVDVSKLFYWAETVLGNLISAFCSMVSDHLSHHPIALLLRRMLLLLRNSPSRLTQLIAKVDILLMDSLSPLLSKQHRMVVALRKHSLSVHKSFKLIDQDQSMRYLNEIVTDYEALSAKAATDRDLDSVLGLQNSCLNTEWTMECFTEGFLDRSMKFLDDISSQYGHVSIGEDWDALDINLYLDCLLRLIDYFLCDFEVDQAVDYYRRLSAAPHVVIQYWDEQNEDRLLGIARKFRESGRSDLSKQVRQLQLDLRSPNSRRVDSIPEVSESEVASLVEGLEVLWSDYEDDSSLN